jgi:hypothetical protein
LIAGVFLCGRADAITPEEANAHKLSGSAAGIDPAFSSAKLWPEADVKSGAPWVYGDGELEAYRLKLLRKRSAETCVNVGYPGVFYEPSPCVCFRLTTDNLPAKLRYQAVGDVQVSVDGVEIVKAANSAEAHSIAFDSKLWAKSGVLQFKLVTTNGEPPALLIKDGPCTTGRSSWECSVDGTNWTQARAFAETKSGEPPHRVELPTIEVKPVGREGELYDFGRTLLGRISFQCQGRPALCVGESVSEAMSKNPVRLEQRIDLERSPDGGWQSKFQLAFRYVRIIGGTPENLKVAAVFRPEQYRGAFACSDERLTRIWMNSAFTLRSCMNDLMLDGLKRDRLPWIGDQAMNLTVDAYTFADAEIFRRTFTALGRNGVEASDINGIVDYSLWWVINQDRFQLFFDDPEYLRREWPRIRALLNFMEARCTADGFLQPRPGAWLFIDWGAEDDKRFTNVSLQAMWFWALESGAALANLAGQPDEAARWQNRATALAKTLRARAWDEEAHGWRLYVEQPGKLSRQANVLAVLSGLATDDERDRIRERLLDTNLPPVITPFMASLELMALSRLGAANAILPRIENYWGAQLDHGATTFWEKYDPARPRELYSMYGRPFGNSLCHAWSSGPAAILPGEIVGIRPLADGWSRFAVDPKLGSLTWAAATVPTPHGDIDVFVGNGKLSLKIPAATVAMFGNREIAGPESISIDMKQSQ